MQRTIKVLPDVIFMSRWLQAPLYVGLIIVLGVYVYEFALGLINIVNIAKLHNETGVMLLALDLIDMVMIRRALGFVEKQSYAHLPAKKATQSDKIETH